MSYFLFRLPGGMYRLERAKTVQEACKLAFGVVYSRGSNVEYKNVGKRSPRYVSQTYQRENWYNDSGWQVMP